MIDLSKTITEGSLLWSYLSPQQKILAGDGAFLWNDSIDHRNEEPTDYSYLVFPYAKMYEGFLKQFFLDIGIITQADYGSTHYRIGRSLSPNLVKRLGHHSAFGELSRRFSRELSEELWHAWKEGRNLVFHYFPHNVRALTREQAGEAISLILRAMNDAVEHTRPVRSYNHVRYGQSKA